MMHLTLGPTRTPPVRDLDVEVVERKGRGHPDSLCDTLAEELSRALSRFYLEHFGTILHHNVDKALLFGGSAQPEFGGGRVIAPWRIYLAGRATIEFEGMDVPADTLAVDAATSWIRGHLRSVDPEHHVEVYPLIRPGSTDLLDLFRRQERADAALANDSSIGVGFAPLTDLETVVLAVESTLTSGGILDQIPEIGEDVKVLGVRRGTGIALTVASAFLGHALPNMRAYLDAKDRVRSVVLDTARSLTKHEVSVEVNVADDVARGVAYITVTGLSAEAGDDGQAGRGNRANGLITPYRPMTLESTAGKNPINHVGKLYQIAAQRISDALQSEIGAVAAAECVLVSQIGHPIDDPQIADVRLEIEGRSSVERYAGEVEEIVRRELDDLRFAWRELITAQATA